MDPTLVYMEPQCRPDYMEALDPGSSRVDYKHIALGIAHHFQYMRMSAHEYIRMISVYQFTGTHIITPGIATHMGHEHFYSLTLEESVQRVDESQLVVVAIAGYSYEWLEGGNLFCQVHAAAEISCVPDLVDRLKKIPELLAKHAMRI
jgi:hypothetical protein